MIWPCQTRLEYSLQEVFEFEQRRRREGRGAPGRKGAFLGGVKYLLEYKQVEYMLERAGSTHEVGKGQLKLDTTDLKSP